MALTIGFIVGSGLLGLGDMADMVVGEFKISVYSTKDNHRAKVIIEVDDMVEQNFMMWMCACEYLLHKTAQKSNAGYEQALELLRKGAMTYKDTEANS